MLLCSHGLPLAFTPSVAHASPVTLTTSSSSLESRVRRQLVAHVGGGHLSAYEPRAVEVVPIREPLQIRDEIRVVLSGLVQVVADKQGVHIRQTLHSLTCLSAAVGGRS